MRLAVRRCEAAVPVQRSSAPLHLIAFDAQRLDAGVERHGACDLAPDGCRAVEPDLGRAVGKRSCHHVAEHSPLRPRRPDPPSRDFRRKNDAPLGRRLGAAALRLVAGGRRKNQDVAVAADQHRRGQHDVVMDAKARPLQRAPGMLRIRQGLQEIPADDPEQVHLAAGRMIDHLRRRPAGR